MKCFVEVRNMRNLLKKCDPLTKSNQQHPSWERTRHSNNHEILDVYRSQNFVFVFRRTWRYTEWGDSILMLSSPLIPRSSKWSVAFRLSKLPRSGQYTFVSIAEERKRVSVRYSPWFQRLWGWMFARNVSADGSLLQTSWLGWVLQCDSCAVRNRSVSLQVMQYLPCWFDIVVWSYCAENRTPLFFNGCRILIASGVQFHASAAVVPLQ